MSTIRLEHALLEDGVADHVLLEVPLRNRNVAPIILVCFLLVTRVKVDPKPHQFSRHLVRHIVMMQVEMLQLSYQRGVEQRLRATVRQSAHRKIERLDVTQDWRAGNSSRDFVRHLAVAEAEISQLWKASARQDRRQVIDRGIRAVSAIAKP